MSLSTILKTRDQIVSDPSSYYYPDYAKCLVGHVYLASTGEEYTLDRRRVFTPAAPTTPFGEAIIEIGLAHGYSYANITPSDVSQINEDAATGVDYRTAAIRVLDKTIDYLT